MSWAPDLQLLSAERNHLKNLPRGLGCVKSLKILQLSYNQISELVPADLANCTNLKELHLQHNLIRSIHPHAFIDLKQLQVLDLSYNLLATIPVPAYQSLRNLNALVDVSFNKWICDCNLQTLRRWIVFDTEVGDASWQVVCASPPEHSGKDLIHLKDSDLTCPTHDYSTSAHYQNVILDEGMQILISCCNGSQDYMQFHWWTPHGQVTDNQPELLIKDITEEYAGLYICVSGLQWKHISVFYLHVYKIGSESRQRRDAPAITDDSTRQDGNINVQRIDGVVRQEKWSESDFVLAVCLSVIITFIVAFIIGVLLRPLLDKLWKRIRPKRQSTPPTASRTSSTGPQIYVNEGYSDQSDQEQEVRVGSRVTFGGITEVEEQGNNVPYYVTVEDNGPDGSSESNTEVDLTYENIQKKNGRQNSPEVEKHRGRADSSRSSALQESKVNALVINTKSLASSSTEERTNAQNTDVKDFKPIPDADDLELKRRSSSSSSHSSESSHSRQSQEINFSAEQSIDPPTVNLSAIETNKKAIISRFTKETFSDWLTRLTEQNVDDLDPELWNDSGESFSFNEGSERSSIQDLSSSVLVQPLKDDNTWRQHKPESPSDKIYLDKKFGKNISVESVQQFEHADILSSNSSECGDSEGGPNNYTINSVLEEESEIVIESDTGNGASLATLNRFSTVEDITRNENSQQGAGILIKQETITLDPYDIHLTFTHGDSVDDRMLTDETKSKSEDVNDFYVNISGRNRSHEGLPQYLVHPVYRTKQNRLNRAHDTDRLSTDSSSEDEEQFTEYPRKLDIKIEPGINTESITSSKNVDNVLNLDFDNSSSSTDVFEEKRTKGKTGLRALSALLFNRHGNEANNRNVQPQVRTGSTNNVDVGRTVGFIGPTFNRHTKLPEERVQQTTDENSLFGCIGLSFDQLPRPKKSILFAISDSQSPNQLSSLPSKDTGNAQKENAESESRRTSLNSSSEESSLNAKNEENILFGQSLSLNQQPKVKRYIHFSHSNPHPKVQLPSPPLTKKLVTPDFIVNNESRRSSSSLEDDTKQTTEVENFFGQVDVAYDGFQKLKRYIEFSHTDPYSTTQPLNKQSISPVLAQLESSSRTSSEDEVKPTSKEDNFFEKIDVSLDRVPKVKRHIQFNQPESYFPTLSFSTHSTMKLEVETSSSTPIRSDVKPDPKDNNFFGQKSMYLDKVQKVKRSIQFTQSKPHCPTLPAFSSSSTKRMTHEITEDNTDTSPVQEEEEENFFREIGVSSNGVSNVKRYIAFKQFDPSSPKAEATSEGEKHSMHSSTSKDNVRSQNNGDTFFDKIGVSFDGVPKVKQYLQLKGPEPHPHQTQSTSLSSTSGVVIPGIVGTEFRGTSSSFENHGNPTAKENEFFGELGISLDRVPQIKRFLQFKQPISHLPVVPHTTSSNTLHGIPEEQIKTESTRLTTSFEDNVTTTEKDNFFVQLGVPKVDRVPKFKRYINFTQPESESPAQATNVLSSQRVSISGVSKETRRSSSSSEDDVKPFTNNRNTIEEPGESLDKVPKVKRYIKLKQFENDSPAMSTFTPLSKVKPIKLTETELSRSNTITEDDVQPANRENQTESRRMSSSSEDDATLTAKQDNFFGQTGASLNRVPKVKKYIHFTPTERHSPAQSTSALSNKKVSISEEARETWRYSTSSDEDVKQSSNDDNFFRGVSLDKSSKVKRYVAFSKSESYSQTQSQAESTLQTLQQSQRLNTQHLGPVVKTEPCSLPEHDVQPKNYENNFYGQIDTSFNQLPKVKRFVEFKQHELHLPVKSSFMEVSPVLMKKGSASVIKTESESWRSDFSYKDNIITRESIDRSVEQTGLKPELRELMSHPQKTPPSLEQDAREYLRDNSQVRQRQERRRLLQQRRKALDQFGIDSLSSLTQEGEKKDSSSFVDYGGATSFHTEITYSNVSTGNPVTSRRTDVAEVPGLQGLKMRNISPVSSKSATPNNKEFLI
ncbi:uncharacterized protein LOC127622342 [Xyrauchen texanus]|uniref:uncharacterized protein LOC127622342 n=1 Tax=Xyrauchen texanus TaxID=154827 RepID=UPI0022420161|nr:uncharacterized protein LOC127622342 [Xyrauchen texanus]